MASIRKRGKSWVANIFKRGIRKSSSFSTKKEAIEWAAAVETEIAQGVRGDIPDKPFADLLTRYADEVSVHKKGARWERIRIGLFKQDLIGEIRLPDLNATHVAEWRDRRLGQVSASSVRREWALLSHACTIARREWRWLKENPFIDVRKPTPSKARTRRPSTDEIERITFSLGYDKEEQPETVMARVGAVWLFAMETAMRAGEIINLTWDNVHLDKRYVHLPKTKNGYARDVPLTREAMRIIEQMRGVDEKRVFALTSQQLDANFRKGRDRAMVDDLHFHDSRREALSRLATMMDVMQLAKISGHRDLRILQNTYYAPGVEELVELLD